VGAGDLSGEILLGGRRRKRATWAHESAYVEQDDLMNPYLTVQEVIEFSAKFRLPASLSEKERKEKVNEIIMDLGLNHCRNSQIGDHTKRGVSGGERKRVSIGQELITTPQVLFLDEPTSGLDAFTAFNIISNIKAIAKKRNKIVIMTIHQPRTDIMDLIDKILLLSSGKTVWLGSTSGALERFEKFGHVLPPNTNPSDFFMDLVTVDQRNANSLETSLTLIKSLTDAWDKSNNDGYVQPLSAEKFKADNRPQFSRSMFSQIFILLHRETKLVARNYADLLAKCFRTVSMIVRLY
jgi:ABC-type multidrug transport system ATPase subunit